MIKIIRRFWSIVLFLVLTSVSVHAQWTSVTPPTVNSSYWYLLAVHFPSADEGWAVGTDLSHNQGVILHYLDGTWSQVETPADSQAYWLQSVYFTSKDEGWVVGSAIGDVRGVIFHYSNGTWSNVEPPAVASSQWTLIDVQFTSSTEGWAVGRDSANGKGIILHYKDGNWTNVDNLPEISSHWWLYRARFTSRDEGWAVGRDAASSSGVFLHYLNGTWKQVQPNPTISGLWQLADVELTSPDKGWAVGGYYHPAVFRYTKDDGDSEGVWSPVSLPGSGCQPGTLWKVSFASADEGWAVSGVEGNCPRFYHYKDGQWSIEVPPFVSGIMYLDGVHFVNPYLGWAVGRDYENRRGVILKYDVPAPPVVYAGENLSVLSEEQNTTIVSGTATDPNGDSLRYRWMEGETLLTAWTDVGPNGEAPLYVNQLGGMSVGQHTLTLEVFDGQHTANDEMILTIGNSAPHAAPTGSGVYPLNTQVILGGQVSDFDGDLLTYEWLEGASVLYTGTIQAAYGGSPASLPNLPLVNFSLGVHNLVLRVRDGINTTFSSAITIEIIDNQAPSLRPYTSTTILWPPDHKMIDVTISANASDNSGGPVYLTAVVSSNEPQDGLGDGDASPDWSAPVIDQAAGTISIQLRAERSGSGSGRIYTVVITGTDLAGNSSSASIQFLVPHDMKKK